jgi:hypothetical protein
MADDPTKHGHQDGNRIHLCEEYEVEYWMRKLNVSAQDLRLAVEKVSNPALIGAEIEDRGRDRSLTV